MIKAINEACIGWLHENCHFVWGVFLVWEMKIFRFWAGIFPHLQGFPQTVGLRKGQGSSYMVEATSKMKGCKIGGTGDIIQGDNSAGHCFVLKILILMTFFK